MDIRHDCKFGCCSNDECGEVALSGQATLDVRHILDNPNMSESDLKKLCDGYFGDANFTSDIRSCSMIYIPINDRGSHWFCIKVDIGIRMAYIFDSKPASRSNMARKKLTRAVLEGLHHALVCQYGDLYQVDVTKFNIATVERQPLLDDTDGYDCGLFVIKFMQGFNYPSGVHRMDDTERPRLLMELCADENNRDALEVMRKFDAWKAGRDECAYVVVIVKIGGTSVGLCDVVCGVMCVEDVQGEILLQEELQLERANKEVSFKAALITNFGLMQL
ncbi:hypothetical protein RHMOL_Rhmol01G0265200 [Rhododendron molle]|uniref:Uncharacterized protein n=1 Tax=Rhododendron molle TaxID=49168 RepID=A0ACC0Q7C3_RHOML|nr:hypothetical protein RHMOL_Rhmol01G0265200 [Rhododendron molle]